MSYVVLILLRGFQLLGISISLHYAVFNIRLEKNSDDIVYLWTETFVQSKRRGHFRTNIFLSYKSFYLLNISWYTFKMRCYLEPCSRLPVLIATILRGQLIMGNLSHQCWLPLVTSCAIDLKFLQQATQERPCNISERLSGIVFWKSKSHLTNSHPITEGKEQ